MSLLKSARRLVRRDAALASAEHQRLLDLTKGRDADLFDRSIDNHVSRLRKKIEPDPKNPRYIKTVWGGGYIFAVDPVTE